MTVDRDEFKAALGRFASGVTVATTRDAHDKPHGLTVTAFSSVSLEPPLILICVSTKTGSHDAFKQRGAFAVNFLNDAQRELSQQFASKIPDKFAGVACHDGLDGVPVIDGVLAALECRLVHSYTGGDHTIYVGEVERTTVGAGAPLLYWHGRYGSFNDG
jgi:flavin reductase (DIM6/NTAB) family NADH-FMN oxidoreductase RutF